MAYALLTNQHSSPRTPLTGTLLELLPESKRGSVWAVDFETRGLLPWTAEFEIVTVGMADADGCFALDWRSFKPAERLYVLEYLRMSELVAFNTYFDAGALLKYQNGFPWVGDAYALFKALSTDQTTRSAWSLDGAINGILGWNVSNKTTIDTILKEQGMTKATLWTLPHDILAPYCAGDADACWQLWQYLVTVNPMVTKYHTEIFMPQVKLLLQQAFAGMLIDKDLLAKGYAQLLADIDTTQTTFLQHPSVLGYSAGEPKKFASATSKAPTANWKAWAKAQKAGETLPFNLNSKAQLSDFFYTFLKRPIVKRTPSGRPAMDKKVLPGLGEEGKLLAKYNTLVKRRGYVSKVIELVQESDVIHPTFNTVGTVTLRPSGNGGFNMLQMPKVPSLLAAFIARPGHKLVQADMEALEPTVLAQFSKCPTMLSIYGKDAKPNDIYLYVAAKIPALGTEILKYYDPANPTAEGIAAAKKHCKRDRQIAKTVQLASAYGAGAKKIHETLALEGLDISLGHVKVIMRDYWKLFAGVKRFDQQLQNYWAATGCIPSILGTPIPVNEKFTKDLVNRFCQASASMVLQVWVKNIEIIRVKNDIPAVPWNVNFYDETVWEVPVEYTSLFASLLTHALDMTNQELQAEIPFKAPPVIVDNLAEIKCPETYPEWLGLK
jgi:DNA polymerase I-like protein with 3'-5' exonuclease and polymerase domains